LNEMKKRETNIKTIKGMVGKNFRFNISAKKKRRIGTLPKI